mmetsp:Transcript_40614/g.115965  ORF Transcript_40614/g.115965 Transcript_40614/m.115965 type:complete len:259 (+) Transcript_40614:494-1270(+)
MYDAFFLVNLGNRGDLHPRAVRDHQPGDHVHSAAAAAATIIDRIQIIGWVSWEKGALATTLSAPRFSALRHIKIKGDAGKQRRQPSGHDDVDSQLDLRPGTLWRLARENGVERPCARRHGHVEAHHPVGALVRAGVGDHVGGAHAGEVRGLRRVGPRALHLRARPLLAALDVRLGRGRELRARRARRRPVLALGPPEPPQDEHQGRGRQPDSLGIANLPCNTSGPDRFDEGLAPELGRRVHANLHHDHIVRFGNMQSL